MTTSSTDAGRTPASQLLASHDSWQHSRRQTVYGVLRPVSRTDGRPRKYAVFSSTCSTRRSSPRAPWRYAMSHHVEENSVRQGFVEPKEFKAIVSNLPEYLRDFARFPYLTRWRRGELQTLTWADVNREAQRITLCSGSLGAEGRYFSEQRAASHCYLRGQKSQPMNPTRTNPAQFAPKSGSVFTGNVCNPMENKRGNGEHGRNRTYNLRIKSPLLCQLSYVPTRLPKHLT